MKKTTLFRFLKLVVLGAIGFAVFYGLVFYLTSNGDAFSSFSEWSKESPFLQEKFGKVKSVHLKFLGDYSEKTRGDKGAARFIAVVNGTSSSGDVNVVMIQTDGVWIVQRAEANGVSIVTNDSLGRGR